MNVVDILAGYALFTTLLGVGLVFRCRCLDSDIKECNEVIDKLNVSVKRLRAENSSFREKANVATDVQKITKLNLQLLHKQEEIDFLKQKVIKQNALLKQKWEASKNVQNG